VRENDAKTTISDTREGMPKIWLLSQGFNRWGSMRKQVFNSSKLTQSRLSEGSEKPYERGQSANSLDGWRVELPQEKKVRHNVRGNNFNNTGIRRDRTAPIGFGRKHFGHFSSFMGNLHTGKEYFQRSKKGMERERKEITAKSFFDEAKKNSGTTARWRGGEKLS